MDERLERTLGHVREQFAQRKSVRHREQLVALLAQVTGAGQLDAEELIARGTAGAPRRFPEVLPIRLGRETVRLPDLDHALPVCPDASCGEAAPFLVDVGFCASAFIAEFFGRS